MNTKIACKILFIFTISLGFSFVVGESIAENHAMLQQKVTDLNFEKKSLVYILKETMNKYGIKCCFEDIESQDGMSVSTTSLKVEKATRLQKVLSDLKKESPIFRWEILGDTIFFRAEALDTVFDNPLDQKIDIFSFKGSMDELLDRMSEAEESLVICTGKSMQDRKKIWSRTYNFDYRKKTAIRKFFVDLNQKHKICWSISVSPTKNYAVLTENIDGADKIVSGPSEVCRINLFMW